MTSGSSPILDYYPPTFVVDMNGKKSAWEGIALIPFIEERRLLAALHSANQATTSPLTASEHARNARVGHEHLIFYDASCRDSYAAPSPAFATIFDLASRAVEWRLPAIPINAAAAASPADSAAAADVKSPISAALTVDQKQAPSSQQALTSIDSSNGGAFVPHLCPGVVTPYPGYPNLRILKAEGSLAAVSVNVFGRESKKESLLLKLSVSDPVALAPFNGNVEAYAQSLVGQR